MFTSVPNIFLHFLIFSAEKRVTEAFGERAENQAQSKIEKKWQALWIYIWRGFMLQTPCICLQLQPLSENTKNPRFDLKRIFIAVFVFFMQYLSFFLQYLSS